jgi:hypothetical protein
MHMNLNLINTSRALFPWLHVIGRSSGMGLNPGAIPSVAFDTLNVNMRGMVKGKYCCSYQPVPKGQTYLFYGSTSKESNYFFRFS